MRPLAFAAIMVVFLVGSLTVNAQQWEALPEEAPAPADNPTSAEKVELGKMLYFDSRLSSNGTVSCFTCHNIMGGGDDHRPTSIGVHGQAGGRSAPTVWNAAFNSAQFWDGRATTLEEQAKGPPLNPIEMGMSDDAATAERIGKIPGYKRYFDQVFGAGNNITMDNIAKAIAAYERTLITPNSSYDRYVKGDKSALGKQQIRGMEKFASSGCTACHSGANFNGPTLPVGEGFYQKFPTHTGNSHVSRYRLMDDIGRMQVTHEEKDKNFWRVPTLRNLVYTAPYMHNGAVKSLDEAVRVMASTQLGKELEEADVNDIVAFLETLTGEFPQQIMPRLPPTPGDLLE